MALAGADEGAPSVAPGIAEVLHQNFIELLPRLIAGQQQATNKPAAR